MKTKIFFLIFVGVFLISFLSAEINLEINVQNSFELEEQIYFEYVLVSDVNIRVEFIPHINCPSAPIAPLTEETIQLQVNQPYTIIYTNQVVQDWFETQTCIAYVQILSPIQQTVSKNFTINTNPSFSFNMLLDKKIFTQNEEITLDYESSVENPSITATLIYPDEDTKKINFPYSFEAKQIGTYELEVTASKEGYKLITKTEQFGVIEEETNIEYGFKESEPSQEKDGGKNNYLIYVLVGGFIFLLVVLIFIAYRLLIKKQVMIS